MEKKQAWDRQEGSLTEVKFCKGCSSIKKLDLDNFYKKLDRFSNYCKPCTKISNKNNYKKHRNKYLEQKKEYWKENKDRITEYRENNKDSLNKTRRIRTRKRRETDPLFKIRKNIPEDIKKAYENKGLKKKSKTKDIVGCDWGSLHRHLCDTFEENYGIPRAYIPWNEVHIDHIIPLYSANNEEDILKLNHYKNLQLLFAYDNIIKSNSLDWELE